MAFAKGSRSLKSSSAASRERTATALPAIHFWSSAATVGDESAGAANPPARVTQQNAIAKIDVGSSRFIKTLPFPELPNSWPVSMLFDDTARAHDRATTADVDLRNRVLLRDPGR